MRVQPLLPSRLPALELRSRSRPGARALGLFRSRFDDLEDPCRPFRPCRGAAWLGRSEGPRGGRRTGADLLGRFPARHRSSVAFDGSGLRSRALAPGARPVDLAIFGTELYWIDGQLGGVSTAPLAGAAAGAAAAPRRLAEAVYPAPNALAVSHGEVFLRRASGDQRLSPSGKLEEEFLWLDGGSASISPWTDTSVLVRRSKPALWP